MARHFFACWPTEDTALALAGIAAEVAPRLEGRPVAGDKVHLTLAFLGETDRVDEAKEIAAQVRGQPFTLVIDRLGTFRRAAVAWAGSSSPDPELLRIQAGLEQALRDRGFALEDRPFNPHVTLARKIRRARLDEPLAPLRWRVNDFALVRSESGRYETIAGWKLG